MRTEAEHTRDLTRALRAEMPDAVIFKINDRITVGIPDIVITWKRATLWLEVKISVNGLIRNHKYWQRQLLQAQELNQQGLCMFIIYEEHSIAITPAPQVNGDRRYVPLIHIDGHKHSQAATSLAHLLSQR